MAAQNNVVNAVNRLNMSFSTSFFVESCWVFQNRNRDCCGASSKGRLIPIRHGLPFPLSETASLLELPSRLSAPHEQFADPLPQASHAALPVCRSSSRIELLSER